MTERSILLISGPNLSQLGIRQPEIYGSETLADIEQVVRAEAQKEAFGLEHTQSEYEGRLIEAVHSARGRHAAIIINPGALTHYGWALADALAAFEGPIIEVHISHIDRREPWRRTSVVSPVASGCISGLGIGGYVLAVQAVSQMLGVTDGEGREWPR